MTVDTFIWGSCQYQTAAESCLMFCELEEQLGRDKILEKLNLKFDLVKTFNVTNFQEDLFENFKECFAEIEDYKRLIKVSNVTDALHFLRDQAWDLWGAAPYIAHMIFLGLDLDELPDAPGLSVEHDAIVDGLEYNTGVACWLLKSYGFVEDEEPFTGFDT